MRPIRPLLLTVLILLFSACTFPGYAPLSLPAASINTDPQVLVEAPPGSTATPTPFQPLPITPTYLPTQPVATEAPPTPSPTETPPPPETADFPGPSEWSPLPIPPPVGRLPQPKGQVNVLLLGSDQRPGDGGFRTDTLLLLTLDPRDGTASLTSFPRDLYVYVPGWTMQRINTAQAHGGFETTAMTFEYNLGVRPDHFVMINFRSFVHIIDDLGGIEVDVGAPLSDQRDGYGYFYVPAGPNHMDGETALWYVRSRMTSNDFDRTRRQQEVLQAVFERLIRLDALARAPDLFETYRQSVTTDLKFEDLAPLLTIAPSLADPARVRHYYIGPAQVTGWVTPTGAQVLLPEREAVLEVMRQALNSP